MCKNILLRISVGSSSRRESDIVEFGFGEYRIDMICSVDEMLGDQDYISCGPAMCDIAFVRLLGGSALLSRCLPSPNAWSNLAS